MSHTVTTMAAISFQGRSGFSGDLDDILANDFAPGPATAIVDIAPGDKGFETSGCGTWTKIG